MESRYSSLFFLACLSVICAMALVACATLPERPEATSPVEGDLPFLIEARVAIRHQEEALSVKIIWQHLPARDKINVFSPFGQQLATIERSEGLYRLIQDGEVKVLTNDIHRLTEDYFGYPIPLAQLPAWLLGVPVSDQITSRAVLPYHVFLADGWRLEYKEFTEAEQRWLPKKAVFSNEQSSIRFVIDRWELGAQK